MANQKTHFRSDLPELRRLKTKDLIRLYPFGISLLPDPQRPILILKNETGDKTLPVGLNPLEAGVALTQFNRTDAPVSPHKVTESLLTSLDLQIEKCVFVEIKGHFQYVRLFLSNHPLMKSMKFRADEAMSLCLHLNVEIYATAEFMLASREMNIHDLIQNEKNGRSAQDRGSGYIQ